MHNYLAKVEQRAFLASEGVDCELYLSDSDSDSDAESKDEEECIGDEDEYEGNKTGFSPLDEPNDSDISICTSGQESEVRRQNLDIRKLKSRNIDLNFASKVLRDVEYNWFAFVTTLESQFEALDLSDFFDEYLVHIAKQLPNSGLSEDERKLTHHSRIVYLDTLEAKQNVCENITHESSDDELDQDTSTISSHDKNDSDKIRVELRRIRDRARKRAKVDIAKEPFLRRKTTKSVKLVEVLFPDIGEVMEAIAESCDVGADKWRRTGVYTFSGDPKNVKRLTFKRLQQKLSDHYGRQFSYGTVVHLCVARNKKRLSSKRYEGLAKIRYQRVRKGFSLWFNPDTKWSRSMYKNLDKLQCDCTNCVLLKRDDQAGFRLDTTFTHKSHGQTTSTRTDFVNKHPCQLQTTCYNFTKTSTTSEACAGVVKSSVIHEKSPSQHAADFKMLLEQDLLKPVFFSKAHL